MGERVGGGKCVERFARVVKEWLTQSQLKLAYLCAHRGLSKSQLLSCARIRALPVHRLEDL